MFCLSPVTVRDRQWHCKLKQVKSQELQAELALVEVGYVRTGQKKKMLVKGRM